MTSAKLMKEVYIATEEVKVRPQQKGVIIEGVALPMGEVSRNGVLYRKESIANTYETLTGRPLLFNHDPNKVIGHVIEAWIDGNNLYYRADVDPAEEDIVRKLKRGDIKNVSISVLYDNPQMNEDYMEVDIKEFLELSIVTIPGYTDTTVELKEKLKETQEEIDRRYQNPDGTFKKQKCGDGSGDEESKFCGCVNYMHNVKGLSWDSAKKLCAYIKKKKSGQSLDTDFLVEVLKEVDKMKNMKEQDEPANPPAENPPEEQPKQDPIAVLTQKVDDLTAKFQELEARITKLENTEKAEEPAPEQPAGENLRAVQVISEGMAEDKLEEILNMIV